MKTLKNEIERVARKTLLIGSMASMLAVPHAFAATGTTTVDIDFPPLLILYYYDNIPITVDAASFATATGMSAPANCSTGAVGVECNVAAAPTTTLTAALGSITADANIGVDGAPAALSTTISFDINNAWAVRAVGGGTGGKLDATFTKGAGEFKAGTVTSDLAGAAGVDASLTLTAGSNIGDLQFDVDLLALADATTASDTITITIVPTP